MENQIIMIEDFSYASMDYTGDSDMPLLDGMQWGDLGKNFTLWFFFSSEFFNFVFFAIQNLLSEIIM